MAVITTRQLLDAGVHFGHQTRRWNPKMKRFIFAERNGIYIIDLQQSLTYIDQAYAFVKNTVAKGGQILFVGTKKQAQEAIAEQATRVGMPYVNQRWLGGMLTNFGTISKRIGKMKELEGLNFDDVAASGLTKKELLQQKRKKEKLAKTLGGIRDMGKLPQAIWVVDTKKEHLAIDEARKLRIPIIGILDTNCDPDEVDFAIPGNDDAIRSVALLTRVVADAVADGLLARSAAATSGEEAEPMPDWERELLATTDTAAVSEAEAVEGSDLQANQLADAADAGVAEAEALAEVAAEEAAEATAEPVAEEAAEATAEPVAEEAAEPVAEAAAEPVAEAAVDAETN
jgi:small subunit ribosomal protein S2